MRLEVRARNGISILDLFGQITINDGTNRVRTKVRELVQSGHSKIIFNLAEIKYVDSTGVGALVASLTTARHAGGELKLLAPGEKVQHLLEISRLLQVFEIYQSEAEAIESFAIASSSPG